MTIQRSKDRIKQTGEVFTPLPLVDEILDKLPPEVFTDPTKSFLDPACGDGNFLIRVLHYKLSHNHDPIHALSTTYGVDIMPDNITQCKARLFKEVFDHCRKNKMMKYAGKHADDFYEILNNNIVWHDALTYHYEFDGTFPDPKYNIQPE